jgi:hypothetical protein
MPLVVRDAATRERITSLDMDTATWDALAAEVRGKRRKLMMPCCGADAGLRTSSRGLRHFYHRNATDIDCAHKRESADHLALKMLIVVALREAGWEAHPEHDEPGWRADVLAVQDETRVAFEVQLSTQDGAETRRRHQRYAASDVRCVWLMKRVPRDITPTSALPAFRIVQDKESGEWFAELGPYEDPTVPVATLVTALAERRVRYTPLKSEYLDISVYNWASACYRCGAETPVVMAYARGVCRCGRGGSEYDQSDDAVGQLVAGSIREGTMVLPLPGSGLARRNSQTAGRPQWSNICVSCGAMQGNFFLARELSDSSPDPAVIGRAPAPSQLEDSVSDYTKHWCIAPSAAPLIQAPNTPREVNTARGSITIDQIIPGFFGP